MAYGNWLHGPGGKDDELASIAYPSYEHSDFERIEKKVKRKLTKTTKYIIQFVTIVMGVIFYPCHQLHSNICSLIVRRINMVPAISL